MHTERHSCACAGEPVTFKAESISWIAPGEAELSSSEVLFLALRLTQHYAKRAAELQKWACWALKHAARAEELGAAWQPPAEFGDKGCELWAPLIAAYDAEWTAGDLEATARAMHDWKGEGRKQGLDAGRLKGHRDKAPKGGRLGQKAKGAKRAPSRLRTFSIMKIARLIKQRGKELRDALADQDEMEQEPTEQEQLGALNEVVLQLQAQNAELKLESDRARDAWRQAAKRAKTAAAAKTAVRAQVRASEKEKYKKRQLAFISAAKEKAAVELQRLASIAEAEAAADLERRRAE